MNRSVLKFGLLWLAVVAACVIPSQSVVAQDNVLKLWPSTPPNDDREVGPEQDFTKPEDRLIAGRRIIKLGNVSTPEMHVYLAPEEIRNGSSVVICPGGGFSILAWDLEGTEVAEWLNGLGVSAIVLKYRVPTRDLDPKWQAPVQDTQRAISLTRAHAEDWGLNPDRVGVLGFSAGGHTAARAAIMTERQYEAVDESDQQSFEPNSAILIYPAWLTNESEDGLLDDLNVTSETPPMFLVHAYDDRVSPLSSALLFVALKKADVPCELHVFESGGHGYGLRPVDDQPITRWPLLCSDWLQRMGWTE
ncbi:Acetylxylan esterase precursor [Thalassoglobus neptunius]|uniref:Acetylxylan esterase n=1 Tax=Thalassoglobus neptunius TaxID=1938619 RepID=A0A5C5VPW6_9PLAN|nr:alpha/beta hydrolase [Thalassoglobus neptunius]TWT39841.1 Acetylxylan esterase precursor [Thalassoglobus neptunius]